MRHILREGNREVIALEGYRHLGAVTHGRDVFPLLTHKLPITRKDRRRQRTPTGGARHRLLTIVPRESPCAVLFAQRPLEHSTKSGPVVRAFL